MQRNMQFIEDFLRGHGDAIPDNAAGIGGARRHVQDRSDAAGASLAAKIYAAPATNDALSQDARYGKKDNNVENIYLPAAEQVSQRRGFLGEMADWLKGL